MHFVHFIGMLLFHLPHLLFTLLIKHLLTFCIGHSNFICLSDSIHCNRSSFHHCAFIRRSLPRCLHLSCHWCGWCRLRHNFRRTRSGCRGTSKWIRHFIYIKIILISTVTSCCFIKLIKIKAVAVNIIKHFRNARIFFAFSVAGKLRSTKACTCINFISYIRFISFTRSTNKLFLIAQRFVFYIKRRNVFIIFKGFCIFTRFFFKEVTLFFLKGFLHWFIATH